MLILLIVFAGVYIVLFSTGVALFYRAPSGADRLAEAIHPSHSKDAPPPRFTLAAGAASLTAAIRPFQRFVPRTSAEISVLQKRMIRAGFRDESAMNMFYGAKALIPLFFCIVLTFLVEFDYGAFFLYAMALGLGYLIPDFWLDSRIKRRQEQIRMGLPDVLDLLVVCIEAGLSIDLAIVRTTAELSILQPEICDELKLLTLEQRAGRGRAEAWRGFADRTNVETIRSLASVLIQADQFGTSVTRALRAHSDTLRTHRRQQLEEKASKTTVKLVFPLVLFIFPSMFLVLMGPSLITLLDSFTQYLSY